MAKIVQRCPKCGSDKFLEAVRPKLGGKPKNPCARCGHLVDFDKLRDAQIDRALKPLKKAHDDLRRIFRK